MGYFHLRDFVLRGAIVLMVIFTAMARKDCAWAAFSSNVSYQEAVPEFLEAITDAAREVKDDQELEDIAQWEEESRERLPEFLNDLIEIARQLEEYGSPEFTNENYQAFADKWNDIAAAYPGLGELEEALSPIVDQLLAGLPALRPPYGENPVQNLIDLYREMVRVDPWEAGAFWVIPPMENEIKEKIISEHFLEKTTEGYRSIVMMYRDVVVKRNSVSVYSELVKDGEIVNKSVVYRDPSVLHEALVEMTQNNEDPQAIAMVEELVDLVDLNIQTVYDKGILDDCSYSFLYRKKLVGTKDTCTDHYGNVQSVPEITAYSPFDHVNQIELSAGPTLNNQEFGPVAEMDGVPVFTSSLIANDSGDMENMLTAWFLGVLMPAYLWSLAGFFRPF